MRSSAIRRSSKLYKTSILISNTPRSHYSSGSSTSSSGKNNNDDINSQFSQLYKHFTEELKGSQNPSFSDMVSAITSSAGLREKINKFTSVATGGAYGDTKPVRIAVTGAAGAIAYSLLFRLASGELLGQRPIILQCLEISKALPALEGVKMELKDCAFPLLQDVVATDDPNKAFEGAEYIFMVGAFPRSKGMERSQLLQMNAGIFSAQGKAINKSADRSNVKTLVVGNPANTNCLIAAYNAPDISPTQFSAMTRLDHNRGISQLADRTNAKVSEIEKFAIWGNHSDTQFPDISSTVINGKAAKDTISDDAWVKNTFIPTVAKRGAAIIAARGTSSAASAANAAIDQMKDWALGSSGQWVSMAVWTGDKGEKVPYGDQGVGSELYYSYPVICEGGKYKIVEGLKMDEDGKKRMKVTNDELEKERSDAGLGHRK